MSRPARQSNYSKRLAGLAAAFAFTAISGGFLYFYRHAVTGDAIPHEKARREGKPASDVAIVYSKNLVDNGILDSHLKDSMDLVLVVPPDQGVEEKTDTNVLAHRFVKDPSRVIVCELDESIKYVLRHLGPVLGPSTSAIKPDPRSLSRRDIILPEGFQHLIPEIQRYVGGIIVIPDDPIQSKEVWNQYSHQVS